MYSFLDLPSNVRNCVYRAFMYSGHLPSRKVIPETAGRWDFSGLGYQFSLNGISHQESLDGPGPHFATLPPNWTSLLLSCRAIDDEVSRIFYSENALFIDQKAEGGLEALELLRPRTVSFLKRLLLVAAQSPTDSTLESYCRAVKYIVGHAYQPQLSLRIMCDFVTLDNIFSNDSKTVKRFLNPLDGATSLADLSIKLSESYDREVSRLVRETVHRAMGHDRVFQFFDLPLELRLKILRHTDLVGLRNETEWAPWSEYDWAVTHRYLPRRNPTCCNGVWYDSICQRQHGGFSRSCHCQLSPLPLFLTCKALRMEAEQVFYQGNRFVLKPGVDFQDGPPFVQRLETSVYLRNVIPDHGLRNLRFLEMVFPPMANSHLSLDVEKPGAAYKDWVETIAIIKSKLHLPRLTLRIYFGGYLGFGVPRYRPMGEHGTDVWLNGNVLKTYRDILMPLRQLREGGLARLYVHTLDMYLVPDRAAIAQLGPRAGYEQGWVAEEIANIERAIMGDYYDHANAARTEPGPSSWLEEWCTT